MKCFTGIITLVFLGFLYSCMTPQSIQRYIIEREHQNSTVQLNEIVISNKKFNQKVPDKSLDILHSDIDVSFIWSQHECLGKETILLKPYFYPTDSIVLDAKGMVLNGIVIKDRAGEEILYQVNYDKKKIKLKLERKLTQLDTITVAINYIARPDEIEKTVGQNGKAIKDEKGLYFINTDNWEPYKPIQLWTQGETESNSAWFPTIDKPNEKFTSTLTIRANKDFTILSNGEKTSSLIEGNVKIEKWENRKPMSAYLMMMAIGNFEVTHEANTIVPVDYYLEKKYAPYAKQIFKHTSEMIDFFSNKLDVPYPWNKYSQVVVHDYVSGAMENTSATLHGESVQKNARALIDNDNDDIIAHELFHQWFGDLVTCKSWSHITLNEGFATYSEQLWNEYKYGTDAALMSAYNGIEKYLKYAKEKSDNPIIDFTYKHPDDVFNSLTYQKGSRVINLLRYELGDEAFFLALKNYLNKYAYNNADIDDLRKEFELVIGRDLTFFFQQWFLKGGHPIINVSYDYIDSTKTVAVTVEQTQNENIGLYKFPMQFKVKDGSLSKEYSFNIEKKKEIFYVKKINEQTDGYPNIIVDPYAIFIGEIIDNASFYYQVKTYRQASNYIEKVRSLKALNLIQSETDTARITLLSALSDKHFDIRLKALNWINWNNEKNYQEAKDVLRNLARNDSTEMVRSAATAILADKKDPNDMNLFTDLTRDSSYNVAGKALAALYKIIPQEGITKAKELEGDARMGLLEEISDIYGKTNDTSHLSFYYNNIPQFFKYQRAMLLSDYVMLVQNINQPNITSDAISYLEKYATKDNIGYVRFTGMMGMNSIAQALVVAANQVKDNTDKAAILEMSNLSKTKMNSIIQSEEEEYVLGMLKMQGLYNGVKE